MSRPRNLNDKSSEYIEQNFLSVNPEGLPPVKDPESIVMATHIPEMRTITFINQRDPGHEVMFHYHSKTHPLKHYTLFHGKEYTLPVEIIEHLEDCAQKQYANRMGPNGHPESYVKGLSYNFRCQRAGSRAA